MQITLKMTEVELREAVQKYITGLGILPAGTEVEVQLTGGGNGKNAEYGATVEFDNVISTAALAAAVAAPAAAAPVEIEQKNVEVKTETKAAPAPNTPESVINDTVYTLSDNSESKSSGEGEALNAKSSADTQVSPQAPDLTEENPENAPFDITPADGPVSKGVSLFNRIPA